MDGTADEGDDYIGMHEVVTFEPGQKEMDIELEIVDDDDWEPDEEFYFKVCPTNFVVTHQINILAEQLIDSISLMRSWASLAQKQKGLKLLAESKPR